MGMTEAEMAFRLTLSCVLGGIIGYEREARHKSAGLRTNLLVCLGSCLIMILSQIIYLDVEGRTNADPARLAAQVVSGIGFLGAGAIMKEGLNVTGLTTAACLWVVAGVGLAVGIGCYTGALVTTAIVFATLGVLQRFDSWFIRENEHIILVRLNDCPGQVSKINDCLENLGLSVYNIKMRSREDAPNPDSRHLTVKLSVYNTTGLKKSVILESLCKLDGVNSVDIK